MEQSELRGDQKFGIGSTRPHGGDNAPLGFPSTVSGEEEAGRR